ncbi:putative Glycosyltransferase [uncultured Desulfobacterium sp.]|uniref:Putative Glycosyltransferase n=1 Tax=uncultured Desulfobacterium sp. TaxID=201089 RepID=A0A445MUH3_9BACT|nr:putative Glycosyltransferase [uncultured Desulfobacterium sp.]
MKIAIVGISFCEYIIQQANGLAALGHNVLVVLPVSLIYTTVGRAIDSLVAVGVTIFACIELRPWKSSYYSDIIYAISSFKPDVIHIHDNGEMITLVLITRFRHVPLALTIHDVVTHPGADSKQKLRRKIIKFLLKRRADVIHLHSNILSDKFKILYPDLEFKIKVIPHGALTLFKSWENELIEREPLTCLFFGRMEKYRGLDNLVHIGRVLKDMIPGIKIIVAGQGSELEKYKDQMDALGIFEIHDTFIPNDNVYKYFRRASLLLLPYHEASQSGVALMGLPFGLPVVATDVGAISEVVIDKIHGRVVASGDITGFAEMVKTLLYDNTRWKHMSENCIEKTDSLNFQRLAYEFAKLYEQAIARKKNL